MIECGNECFYNLADSINKGKKVEQTTLEDELYKITETATGKVKNTEYLKEIILTSRIPEDFSLNLQRAQHNPAAYLAVLQTVLKIGESLRLPFAKRIKDLPDNFKSAVKGVEKSEYGKTIDAIANQEFIKGKYLEQIKKEQQKQNKKKSKPVSGETHGGMVEE